MKHIILIGPSYSGKSELANKLVKLGYIYYSIGDLCRSLNYPPETCLSNKQISNIVKTNIAFSNPVIIDNLFKTEDSVKVLDDLNLDNFIVICVNDSLRTNINFTARKRIDDNHIIEKREIWNKNVKGIFDELAKRNIHIHIIYNTNDGFLLKI